MLTTDLDRAYRRLEQLIAAVDQLKIVDLTEADTRANLIDPMLVEVLGWTDVGSMSREAASTDGGQVRYADYILATTEPLVAVEAKRAAVDFNIPSSLKGRKVKLDGAIKSWPNAISAIRQAREYCDRSGARYGLVTNGLQYLIFEAITFGHPWTQGGAIIYKNLAEIRDDFSSFYRGLSRINCGTGYLANCINPLGPAQFQQKPRRQVPATGRNRNPLHDLLHQLFVEVFLDVQAPTPEFLRSCYCTADDAIPFADKLSASIIDPDPSAINPPHRVRAGHNKDSFHAQVGAFSDSPNTPVFLLLGGTGVGKTTFLHWYFDTHLDRSARSNTVVARCDFRNMIVEPTTLYAGVLKTLIGEFRKGAGTLVDSFESLKAMFRDEVDAAKRGVLKPYMQETAELEKRVGALLEKLMDDHEKYLAALIRHLKGQCRKRVVIILDNADQKSEEIQSGLYHVANSLTRSTGAIVVLALRETTFYRLSDRDVLSAFTTVDFHIKAQPFNAILHKRLQYLIQRARKDQYPKSLLLSKSMVVADVEQFIQLLVRSFVPEDGPSEIVDCIASLTNGDSRRQLRLVYDFLVSGQTPMARYFWDYSRKALSVIPLHEFLHSAIMADRKVYEERIDGDFMNLFEVPRGPHASHFLALRIIAHFIVNLEQEGRLRISDFVAPVDVLQSVSGSVASEEAFEYVVRRMLAFGLLSTRGAPPADDEGIGPFALTVAGVYSFRVLYKLACYFGLMAHDTNMYDEAACGDIGATLQKHANEEKLSLLARIQISERFTRYVHEREGREVALAAKGVGAGIYAIRFAEHMQADIERLKRERTTP